MHFVMCNLNFTFCVDKNLNKYLSHLYETYPSECDTGKCLCFKMTQNYIFLISSIFPWLYFQYSTIQAASLLLCPWVWQPLRCSRLSEGGRLSALCPVPPGRYGRVRRTAAEVSLWAGYPRGHICYTGKLECSSIMTRIKRQCHAHNVNH